MNNFTRYTDEANRRFQNIGTCTLSEVRRIFDKIPNCAPSDEDFDEALKKAKARTFRDKVLQTDSALARDDILRIAAELDRQVRERRKATFDRLDAEQRARYEAEDRLLERKAQFEKAKLNEAALIAKGIAKGANDD